MFWVIIILSILLICQLINIYFYFRNQWVRREYLKFIDQVYEYRIKLITNNIPDWVEISYDDMMNCLKSYNKILFQQFWKWNINDFVIDKELYNKIVKL